MPIDGYTSYTCPSYNHYAVNRYPCGNCAAASTATNVSTTQTLVTGKWYADSTGTYMYEVTGAGSSGGVIENAFSVAYNTCAGVQCPV